jgi:hypothetical protein
LRACSVVRTKAGEFFVLPPSMPMLTRDGVALRDDAGKVRYAAAVVFTRDAGRRFSNAVLEALRRAHPEMLAGAGGNASAARLS